MRSVALTGGLATGKSFVRVAFARLGVPTFDADAAARVAVAPGTPGLGAVAARFGPAVLDVSGALDRRTLAALVFDDATARRDLEAIVHPAVRRARDAWLARLPDSPPGFCVADIPLLYEAKLEDGFDAVIVVVCDPAAQVARAVARGGMTEADARRRIAAQLPIEEKAARADHIIRTNGTKTDTLGQVRALYDTLRDESAG
jgi:dephospho-CoA kinase